MVPRISYCLNVFPGSTLDEVMETLRTRIPRIRSLLSEPDSFAAGLWLCAGAVERLGSDTQAIEDLVATLGTLRTPVVTLNVFPYHPFHARRVKEQVYEPSWLDERRLDYTAAAARVLARILPEGESGTLSTLAGGFKPVLLPAGHAEERRDVWRRVAAQYGRAAGRLERIARESARTIRLCIEPEPWTLLETGEEVIGFFEEALRTQGPKAAESEGALCGAEALDRHLGICYDACHQAVQFEDPRTFVEGLAAARIPIGKVHLSAAVERPAGVPAETLRPFDEGRWLHQVVARDPEGKLSRHLDLEVVLGAPLPEAVAASTWRVHFHVPVFARTLGPLRTTQDDLLEALRAILEAPKPHPVLEVETYTWNVIPPPECRMLENEGVEAGIAREIEWVRRAVRS